MSIFGIELSPEVEQWVARNLGSGQFASPEDFINARPTQDWLEDKIEEALLDPASPLTKDDWGDARKPLEESIQKQG